MGSRSKMTALLALGLPAVGAFALGSLVSGASYLEAALPGGLPLGNALAALGLCAIAGTGVALARRGVMHRIALVVLLAAAAWLPVSIAMAGNLALVFSGTRGDAWIAWSGGVAILSVASLVLAVFQRLAMCVWPRSMSAGPRQR